MKSTHARNGVGSEVHQQQNGRAYQHEQHAKVELAPGRAHF